MFTGNFKSHKHNENGVSIAAGSPIWFDGEKYPLLYPPWWLIRLYKKTADETLFSEIYEREVLSRLNPEQVLNDLKGKTILCWEKSGCFCHRRQVADWIESHISFAVREI